MTQRQNSPGEKYWSEYDGLQHAKHQLLSKYLAGWFPILSSWSGHVLYIDSHAGRGRHKTGHEGSPLLAVRTLREHKLRARILDSTTVDFVFMEINQENYDSLCSEIASLRWQADSVSIRCFYEDYESRLRQILDEHTRAGTQLGPTFAFVDPFGFSLSMDLLNDLLSVPHTELLVNFMYRFVDMAMYNPPQADNLDTLFGGPQWRQLADIGDYDQRTEATIGLFADQLDAAFVTHMRMHASNGTLKYVLFHATNERRGREVIRDAMWSVSPDGSFRAFEHHAPEQLVLFAPEPDFEPLKARLWARFAGTDVRYKEIEDWLLGELYRVPHLRALLREYRDQGILTFSDFGARFAFRNDPLVSFPPERPSGPGKTLSLF